MLSTGNFFIHLFIHSLIQHALSTYLLSSTDRILKWVKYASLCQEIQSYGKNQRDAKYIYISLQKK